MDLKLISTTECAPNTKHKSNRQMLQRTENRSLKIKSFWEGNEHGMILRLTGASYNLKITLCICRRFHENFIEKLARHRA